MGHEKHGSSTEGAAPLGNRRAMLILLFASAALVLYVFAPLATPLFLAGILASLLYPLHRRLAALLRGSRSLSAGLIVTALALLIAGPLVGILTWMVQEGIDAGRYVLETIRSERAAELIARLPGGVRSIVERLIIWLSEAGGKLDMGKVGGQAASALGAAASATGALLFGGAMMLIALFLFLLQREVILSWVEESSPISKGSTRELMREVRAISSAVIASTALTAATQAIVALVGYLIAGVPQPLFFTLVTFFIAFVPAVGAASVCIVAALLLLITGHLGPAIFLAIWAVGAVALIDNILKPLFVKLGKNITMNGGVLFFALIGGVASMGAIGLLLGPIAVALFAAALRIYKRDHAA